MLTVNSTQVNSELNLMRQLQQLDNESNFTFILTGSRKFGGARTDSDYDFYTEDSANTRDYLLSVGFTELIASVDLAKAYPDDPNVCAVYRWQSGIHQIDVQLVRDVKRKAIVEEIIYMTHVTYSLDKMQIRRVWKALYSALDKAQMLSL